MTTIRIEQVPHGSAGWHDAVRLRDRVLRAPLGLAFDPVELAREDAQVHLALYRGDGALAGAAVLVPPAAPGMATAKLRQMAVAPEARGRGFGTALVEAAEALLWARGAAGIVLHARVGAMPFYARLGYLAEGEVFEEVTLPHQRMWKPRPPVGGARSPADAAAHADADAGRRS